MSQNAYLSLVGSGLAAARPLAPELPSSLFYYATDTGVLSIWTGAAWLVIYTAGVTIGVTASVTQTLVAATQLSQGNNVIAVCATIGNAVKLPQSPAVGQECLVINNGAAAASIFPGESTSTIDGAGAGAAVTLTQAKSALFLCTAAGAWISSGQGGHSA